MGTVKQRMRRELSGAMLTPDTHGAVISVNLIGIRNTGRMRHAPLRSLEAINAVDSAEATLKVQTEA